MNLEQTYFIHINSIKRQSTYVQLHIHVHLNQEMVIMEIYLQ